MKNKKLGRGLDPLVTVFIIIVIAVLLTYIMPAGQFADAVDEAGNKIIDMDTFEFVDRAPVSFLSIPQLIANAFSSPSLSGLSSSPPWRFITISKMDFSAFSRTS